MSGWKSRQGAAPFLCMENKLHVTGVWGLSISKGFSSNLLLKIVCIVSN